MKGYISNIDDHYYEGDQQDDDLEVDQRPSLDHDWNGSAWIVNDVRSNKTAIDAAKKIRDEALNALTHDFGDGRIMQTRPKDESIIRNAIEIMEANSIPSIGWSMIDDVKQVVTVIDLQEALSAGQLAAMQIWNNYNP